MSTTTINRFVLLQRSGSKATKKIMGVRICRTEDDVLSAVKKGRYPFWVSRNDKLTTRFLKAASANPNYKLPCLITLTPPRPQCVPSLQGVVQRLIGASDDHKWLPWDELQEVLAAPDGECEDIFLGGTADPVTETIALIRGNLELVTLPFSMFLPSPSGVKPDFLRLSFTDYGRTVCFGDYEAASDSILYELDPVFRRRLNQQRQAEEKTFGASLRRLRKQRELKRSDFAPITEKTVARLERNESAKPHGKTLQTLADRLGVLPDEIESF